MRCPTSTRAWHGLGLLLAACLWTSALAGAASAMATFVRLDPLPDGLDLVPRGVSADGGTVVGYCNTSGNPRAFRWTAATGVEDIGGYTADAISDDGTRIVGKCVSGSHLEACYWTPDAQSTVLLGELPGGTEFSAARGVSADGSVIVGVSNGGPYGTAFRWTESTGLVDLGSLRPDNPLSSAYDVSANGATVVGYSKALYFDQRAFVWTQETGMRAVFNFRSPSATGQLRAISPDGAWAVGAIATTFEGDVDGTGALRLAVDGLVRQELGTLDDSLLDPTAVALAVSADGSVVVGSSTGGGAFVWDEVHGMRTVEELLTGHGLDVAGWQLTSAVALSADGRTIVGAGIAPGNARVGWVATVPSLGLPGEVRSLGPIGAVTMAVAIAMLGAGTLGRRSSPRAAG